MKTTSFEIFIFVSNIYSAVLQEEMDSLVEQMKVEREMCEKAQEEQKLVRERWMTAAATCIQTLFRGYRCDNVNYCMFTL